MDSQSNMTHSYSSIDDTPDVKPLVELTSKMNEDELLFTISGINVSFANAIRRVILSEIPMVVFRVSPNDKNKLIKEKKTLESNAIKTQIEKNKNSIDSYNLNKKKIIYNQYAGSSSTLRNVSLQYTVPSNKSAKINFCYAQ